MSGCINRLANHLQRKMMMQFEGSATDRVPKTGVLLELRFRVYRKMSFAKCTTWFAARQRCEWTDCSRGGHSTAQRLRRSGTALL
jgi:hypothetical protein